MTDPRDHDAPIWAITMAEMRSPDTFWRVWCKTERQVFPSVPDGVVDADLDPVR